MDTEENLPQSMLDDSWFEWAIKGLAGFLLMLISVGIKDIRERLRKIDELDRQCAVMEERITNLSAKIREIENSDARIQK